MMYKKSFELNVKELHDENGERSFVGYGSTFANVDHVGDIVKAGAFEKSLDLHKTNGTMPAMLIHHDLNRPIGVWKSMVEDDHGLLVEGKLTKGVRDADEAYALLKDGALHSMSIGYRVIDEEYDRKSGINTLNEISLHELSLVTLPANAAAVVSSVKNADGSPDIREIERVLRDAGFSRREAKAFISEGFKSLVREEVEVVPVPVIDVSDEAAVKRKADIQDLLNQLGK